MGTYHRRWVDLTAEAAARYEEDLGEYEAERAAVAEYCAGMSRREAERWAVVQREQYEMRRYRERQQGER